LPRGNPISQLITGNKCRNCDTLFDGIYCPACGQKKVDLERPISELIGEVVKETFDIDGRALRTVKTLFLRPGTLTREFLEGRRTAFTPPLRLYLVSSRLRRDRGDQQFQDTVGLKGSFGRLQQPHFFMINAVHHLHEEYSIL